MIGRTISHFRIIGKIGEGGMGVVYEAEDERLGRRVAIKVLPPEYVDNEERRRRFLQEARTIASVTHPHIATIHEVDEFEGNVFIAMELVEGRTLTELISQGSLPVRDALRYAIEISEALAASHEAGVTHRDLKPENIIVGQDGHVRILDFGLAKLREGAGTPDAATKVVSDMTAPGHVLGTASYMSPEQARGRDVDARTDLFSLGVVLYEMVTGKRPFRGSSSSDVLSAVLRDSPTRASAHNAEVSAELDAILEKCLEKDVKDRYQHADELVVDLRRLRRKTDSHAIPAPSSGDMPPSGREWRGARAAVIAAAAVVLAVLVVLTARLLRPNRPGAVVEAADTSLAILPFQNLHDASDEHRLGRIFQELMITDLSGLEPLKVFSSQRLFDIQKQLGRPDVARIDAEVATDVARRAGASRMLTGSLSQLGANWIVTCQLVDLRDGSVVSSERIDGSDLYTMVDRLAAEIRRDLGVARKGKMGELAVTEKTTESMEALRHFVLGVDALNRCEYGVAVADLERAIEADPRFGEAHYKLAIARWWAASDGEVHRLIDQDAPAAALADALSGDVKLADWQRELASAFVPLLRRDWTKARSEFQLLVRQYPEEKEAWYGLGEAVLHGPGAAQDAEAVTPFLRALELDPQFHLAAVHVYQFYVGRRMYDEAIETTRALIDSAPGKASAFWYAYWIQALAQGGGGEGIDAAIDEALASIAEPEGRIDVLCSAADGLWNRGAEDRARGILERALDLESPAGKARVHAAFGLYDLEDHRFGDGERSFRRALELDPGSASALHGLFGVFKAERRFDEAIRYASDLIRETPDTPSLYLYRIDAAIQTGDLTQAEEAVAAALRHCPAASQKRDLWVEVGWVYFGVGDAVRARDCFGKALAAEPERESPAVFNGLGWAAQRSEDYDAAKEWFERGCAVSPSHGAILNGLSQVHSRLGNHDEAIAYGRRRVDVAPEEPWAHWTLLRALIRAGRLDETLQQLDSALPILRSLRDRRRLLVAVGDQLQWVGRLDEAAELVRRAGELGAAERDPEFHRSRGALAIRRARYGDAERALERARQVAPRDFGLLSAEVVLELARGRPRNAERRLRALHEEGPVTSWTWRLLAYSLCEQGRYEQARSAAERGLRMLPDRRAHGLLAWVLVAGDLDVERGRELAEQAAAFRGEPGVDEFPWPFMAPAEHTLGLASLKAGRFAEAVEFLRQAAGSYPERPSIRKHLREAEAKADVAPG